MTIGDFNHIFITSANTNTGWLTPKLNLPTDEDFQKLQARISIIEERLAILEPNQPLQDKFPALQEAYDAYKIIERLVK